MALLHNRVSQKELKERLYQETESRTTISFYQYFSIDDPGKFRDELYKGLVALNVFGRIYVAHEGINAQLSVPQSHFGSMKNYLYSIEQLNGVRLNIAIDDDGKSFWVLKIKVRDKIVSDGITDPSFSMNNKGKYVNAEQMNDLMNDPDTIVIDMRNHYEYEVGHFENALEVPSDTFKQQLPMAVDMMKDKKEKNIVMYCTGGIRCEKASAYMLHNGFKNVFHLEGGIINYARESKEAGLKSKFIGKNFVFDDRLGERITEDIIAKCHQCGRPADTHTNCVNSGCHLLFIQCDECAKKYEGCCSKECLDVIHLPEEEQKNIRAGIDKGRNIFNKSRQRLRPKFNNSGMNMLFFSLSFLLSLCFGCKDRPSEAIKASHLPMKFEGLKVDSAIRRRVMEEMKDNALYGNEMMGMAKMDIMAFENDKEVSRSLATGNAIPFYAFAFAPHHDTTTFTISHIMPLSFGFWIRWYKDYCNVTHIYSIRGDGPKYRVGGDSSYRRSLFAACNFNLVLDKSEYRKDEPIYGLIEGVTEDFFIRTDTGDLRSRVEFRGYFRAPLKVN